MRPETLVVVTQGSLQVGDAPARRTRGRTRNPSDYKALRMDRECPNFEVHDIRGIFVFRRKVDYSQLDPGRLCLIMQSHPVESEEYR